MVVDQFSGDTAAIVAVAAAMAPFPHAGNHYPGVRRVIGSGDAAYGYVERLLEQAAPLISGAYDVERFSLIEASFSLVTLPASELSIVQRAPHFDSTEPHYFAVMHYLRDTAGTAFYRHRATGIERVTEANVTRFVNAASRENGHAEASYISDTNDFYERIGHVDGHADRLVIYPGNLLHSGIIAPGTLLSDNPAVGRLTTNIFIRSA